MQPRMNLELKLPKQNVLTAASPLTLSNLDRELKLAMQVFENGSSTASIKSVALASANRCSESAACLANWSEIASSWRARYRLNRMAKNTSQPREYTPR